MENNEFKIIRLPRNGPKPGRSTENWLYGKQEGFRRDQEAAEWKRMRSNKKGPSGGRRNGDKKKP